MGAHPKYRTMMQELTKVGVDINIHRQGEKAYKLSVGTKERIFRLRSTCNRHLEKIFTKETNKTLLFY